MAEHPIMPSNANKLKTLHEKRIAERPRGKPIATLVSDKPKESAGKRFIRRLLAEDVDDIGDYVVWDLIIPGAKDVFFKFLWALLWGDRKDSSGSSRSDRTPYYKSSYLTRSRGVDSPRREEKSKPEPEKFDPCNLKFDSKSYAEDVWKALFDYLQDYPNGYVTIGYLKECLQSDNGSKIISEFTDEYLGWSSVGSEPKIRPTSGGKWLLTLPQPEKL